MMRGSAGLPASAHTFAQTNLQLYNQLLATGYQDSDLDLVRRSYDLAAELFSGRYRPTGKPFLAHLVGTASILAAMKATVPALGAGLLHAAYTQGDFGPGSPGTRGPERIRRSTSPEVEDLIARYTRLPWTLHSVPGLRSRLGELSSNDREVIAIRLANELEDFLDLGLLYCRKGDDYQLSTGEYTDAVVAIAKELGLAELAEALDQAVAQNRTGPVPPAALRAERSGSYVVLSASYGPRPVVQARAVGSLVERVARYGLRKARAVAGRARRLT